MSDQKMKRCQYCGEEILEIAKKCKHCGTMLGDSPTPPQSAQSKKGQDCTAEVKKKRNTYIIMCVIVAVLYIAFEANTEGGISGALLGMLLTVALVFFYKCYKCPSCRKYVNILMPPQFCQKCGAQLKSKK